MADIIQFPKMKLDSPPQSPEELSQKLEEYKMSFAEDISESLWNLVLMEMVRSGCRFDEELENFYPSMVLIYESIKSLHLQASGIEHPLQEFAAENFSQEISEEMVDIDDGLE